MCVCAPAQTEQNLFYQHPLENPGDLVSTRAPLSALFPTAAILAPGSPPVFSVTAHGPIPPFSLAARRAEIAG